jgi:hypothetical protein
MWGRNQWTLGQTKVLDGGTLGRDSSATQCPVENNAWGHQAKIKRGQKWTQHKNAVGWEDKVMMLYAKVGQELEKESEGGKRGTCHWWKGEEGWTNR